MTTLSSKKPRGRLKRPFWMLAPGGILMTAIIIVPFGLAVYFATVNLDQYTLRSWGDAPFTGWQNLREAFQETNLLHSIGISAAFALICTIVTLPLGIAAALATHQPFRGRGIVRSLFLVPYVLPAFVIGTVWRTMLQPGGVVNSLFGLGDTLWLIGPNSFWALCFVNIWSSWPFIYLLCLAGLQAIPREVHEAGALDGATWRQKLRFIVLPHVKGPIALAALISTLHHFNAYTLPAILFGTPAPYEVEVLPILTFQTSFTTFRFGLGAAMSIVSLIIILIPLLVYLRAVNLDRGEDSR